MVHQRDGLVGIAVQYQEVASWLPVLNDGKHIIRRQRPPDPLQRELTHWLDLHGVLDLHQHARADENLPRFCLIAQPRGHVGNRTNRAPVYGWFTEGFDTRDLKEAKALLEELASKGVRSSACDSVNQRQQ